MRRYGLRDDQWDRIKDFFPGEMGTLAGRRKIIDCSSKRYSGIEYSAFLAFPNVARCSLASVLLRRVGRIVGTFSCGHFFAFDNLVADVHRDTVSR